MQTKQARVFGVISRAAHHYMKKIGEPYQINAIECLMLLQIAEQEDMTQEQISTVLVVDKSITTRAMQKFQRQNWVIKKNKQEDKRAFVIAISPDGQKIVNDLNHQLNQWNDYLADGMDNKDMANLFSVLDKMAAKALIAEEEGYGVILQNVVKPE